MSAKLQTTGIAEHWPIQSDCGRAADDTPVREWEYDPREDGQVALGGPILQDARARRAGV